MTQLVPTASLIDSTVTTVQQKNNFANLRAFIAELLGTDSNNKAAARAVLGAASIDPGSLLGINGYQRFQSGIIIQAGFINCDGNGSAIVTFPVAYATQTPIIVATPLVASFGSYGINISGRSGGGFSANSTLANFGGVPGLGFHWVSFGY